MAAIIDAASFARSNLVRRLIIRKFELSWFLRVSAIDVPALIFFQLAEEKISQIV